MAASHCSKLFSTTPIVVILGATGTGKSKLAIELAKRFHGEIISADSMQVYEGLDIATNKVTKQEQEEVPHHLIGFLHPSKTLKVGEFRNHALNAILDIVERKALPIIVGGTNYYIEAILYNNMLIDLPKTENDEELPAKKFKIEESDYDLEKYNGITNDQLYERLREVDPEKAELLHPNNRRKIIRSLQVFEQHGEKMSNIINKQRTQWKEHFRFRNACVLWLQCETNVLLQRLYDRVDKMISQGLIKELLDFHKRYNQAELLENKEPDYTKGIFQTIGFKEFHKYLILDEESRNTEKGEKLLAECTELLKIANRQYAKRQHKWVTNRLLQSGYREVPSTYGLNATDVNKWKENVYDVAEQIVDCHLQGRKPQVEPLPLLGDRVEIDKLYKCDTCNKILVGAQQYQTHLNGARHKNAVRKAKLKLNLGKEKDLAEKVETTEETQEQKEES